MGVKLSERVGESFLKDGFSFKILRYVNNKEIYVGIYKGSQKLGSVKTSYNNFKRTSVSNPFSPKVCGVGFLGVSGATSESELAYKIYKCWQDMIHRCYNPKNSSYKRYGGIGIVVSEEWKNFSNFKKWYLENLYESGSPLHLDKDVLSFLKGEDKVYSSETCLLLPQDINVMLVERNGEIAGYSIDKDGVYVVYLSTSGNHKNLGRFKTEKEARSVYTKAKNLSIKEVATKSNLPLFVLENLVLFANKKYPLEG